MKIARDEFSVLPPCGHIDEVRLRLFSVLCTVTAVDGDREGSDRNAGRRAFQLKIVCYTSAQNDLIEVEAAHDSLVLLFLKKRFEYFSHVCVFRDIDDLPDGVLLFY